MDIRILREKPYHWKNKLVVRISKGGVVDRVAKNGGCVLSLHMRGKILGGRGSSTS